MRRYAVVGSPVRHSRSPWLHGFFARRTQRDILYAALQPRDTFAACCGEFFGGGGSGLNITLPYKADALEFAESASAFARRCGAANVLKREADGGIRAYNTDGSGLLRDLQQQGGDPAGKNVLLLGAGGAARAAAHALADAAPARLWICNRTAARAEQLAAACGGCARAVSLEEAAADAHGGAHLVINATSAGHGGNGNNGNEGGGDIALPPRIFGGAALAYDLSYGAAAQPFLRAAAAGGASRAADGMGMLVWQAALSFAIWEGVLPPAQAAIRQLRGN